MISKKNGNKYELIIQTRESNIITITMKHPPSWKTKSKGIELKLRSTRTKIHK